MVTINKKYHFVDQSVIKHYEENAWTRTQSREAKYSIPYSDKTASKKYTLVKMEKLSLHSYLDRFIAVLMAVATLGFGLLDKSFKEKIDDLWKGKEVRYFALDTHASSAESNQENFIHMQQDNEKLKEEVRKHEETIAAFDQNMNKILQENSQMLFKIERIQQDNKKLEEEARKNEETIANLKKSLDRAPAIDSPTLSTTEQENIMIKLKKACNKLKQEYEKLEDNTNKDKFTIRTLRDSQKNLIAECNKYENEITQLNGEIAQLKQFLKNKTLPTSRSRNKEKQRSARTNPIVQNPDSANSMLVSDTPQSSSKELLQSSIFSS